MSGRAKNYRIPTVFALTLFSSLITSCGDGVTTTDNDPSPSALDIELRALTQSADVSGDILAGRTLPEVTDPLAALGRDLFFTKGLSGDMEVACVTCHHPNLGGTDELSLSVGTGAIDPTLMGPGRIHESMEGPNVPRNAPTIFNAALWDRFLFLDGKIESLETLQTNNGMGARIRTPDTMPGVQDITAGPNLAAAQSRFPVTSPAEMRTDNFLVGEDRFALRDRLAQRIGDYEAGAGELAENNWLPIFRSAFNQPNADAPSLITFDNISTAIGEYERTMNFVNNPFNEWVNGDLNAITEEQKRGAVLFYTPTEQGGAGCANCHSGDFFTDEEMHVIGSIQIGDGKGNGEDGTDDFGRELLSGDPADRYKYRTSSLLNIAVTGPYFHAGSYDTLEEVMLHYSNPIAGVNLWFQRGAVCSLVQFKDVANCADLYPSARANTQRVLDLIESNRDEEGIRFRNSNINPQQQSEIVAFLEALTDPCVVDPECLAPWIPDPNQNGPDGLQINGVNRFGVPLAESANP
ncbi:MAG: cytochrome c peroxidase [Halioglobus sp.]|jgi:cytochrome c peroxidase